MSTTPETTPTVADLQQQVAALTAANTALESRNVVLEAQRDAAAQENVRLRAEAKTASDRAIEMMAQVGQSTPVPADPKQTANAQPKKSLTQMCREKLGW